MAVSEVLKKFRGSDYGANKEEPEEEMDDAPEAVRTIMLSDDEAKAFQSTGVHPGEEITLEVTGKLENDGHVQVMSVQPSNGGMEKEDMAKVAGVTPPPMTQPMA